MLRAIALPFLALLALSAAAGTTRAEEPRVFEMRIYTTHDGKLDALNARFRNHTNKLFEKHGMDLVAYWTPLEGDEAKNTLIYVLAYPSREATTV